MMSISSNLIGKMLCFHYQPIMYLYVLQMEIIFLLWCNSSSSIRLISRKFSIATMLFSSSSTSSSVGSSLVPLFSWVLNLENRDLLWLSVSHACLVKIIWSKWSLWVLIHFETSAGLAFQPVLPSSKMTWTNFSQRLVNLVGGFHKDNKTFVKWVKKDSLFLGQAFRKVDDLFQSCQVYLSIFYCPDQGHCHQSSQTC